MVESIIKEIPGTWRYKVNGRLFAGIEAIDGLIVVATSEYSFWIGDEVGFGRNFERADAIPDGPVVIPGRWRNIASGHVVQDPEAWNDIVIVHVGIWGWFGCMDYFLVEWERIGDGEG